MLMVTVLALACALILSFKYYRSLNKRIGIHWPTLIKLLILAFIVGILLAHIRALS